jgi:hypothetical protein
MAISPIPVPKKFVDAVREKKRKEDQEKAAKDTKAIRQSFGKDGDKMDYQSSQKALKDAKKPTETVKKGQDVISDKMSFGKAFRAARNEGMKTFTWRGKKYGTKLKSEVKKKESTPKAKAAPATQLLPDVATSQRAEQKKAREEAVKGVEQNIAASTSQKPAVDTKKSQIEKVKKAIATIDKSISQMQNNPSGYFGLLSGKQKNQRIKLRKRKEMLQKKLKNLS